MAILAISNATVGSVGARDYAVDTSADNPALADCDPMIPADCSLRGALTSANSLPDTEASTISLPDGAYELTALATCSVQTTQFGLVGASNSPTLCVAGRITLIGASTANTVIDGGGRDRVMLVGSDAPVRIERLTIRGGDQRGGSLFGGGGGINNAGDLTLVDCAVQASVARGKGGGVYNSGTLTMRRCVVTANTAANGGGGIYSDSFNIPVDATIVDSTIAGNVSLESQGGGIAIYGGNHGGQTTIQNSTISDNEATLTGGGGIVVSGLASTVHITNSTVSGNRAGWAMGGGIWQEGTGEVRLANVTVTRNRSRNLDGTRGAGGGIAKAEGSIFTLANTIVAGNEAPEFSPDCYDGGRASTFGSDGYNLIGVQDGAGASGTNCDLTGGAGTDLIGTDPLLGALTDNGGLTQTHAPGGGSPAIDSGDPAGCKDAEGSVLGGDQRGEPRPEDGDGDGDARCDRGAVESGGALGVDDVGPPHAGNVGPVCALLHGHGFADGASVVLTKPGVAPIPGTPVHAAESGLVLATAFDLRGAMPGTYDVTVTNPDGRSATASGAFVVDSGGAPEIWSEIIGPASVRRGRPFRYFLFYGNRGNADALGVPAQIAVPPGVNLELRFPLAPPPVAPGQVIADWRPFSQFVDARPATDFQVVPFLLPIVPAGWTGVLEIRIVVPTTATDSSIQIVPMIGSPYARPDGPDADSDVDVDPDFVRPHVANAVRFAREVLGVTGPLDETFIEQYLTDQFERVVGQGAAAWISRLGVPSEGGGAGGAGGQAGDPGYGDGYSGADAGSAGAEHDGYEVPPIPAGTGGPCAGDCMNGCASKKKWPGGRKCSCPWDTDVRFPFDPNDKVGSVMGSGYISGSEPLRYAIYFENDPLLANAPAQEVVVTDRLDASMLDLDTFSLGPISFGDRQVIPIAGLKQFETDIDLRPQQDLLVRIRAALDVATGVVTWRFSSLDPVTMAPPEDPLAGFLPPNLLPPQGDGSVTFGVRYKEELVSGARICNDAEIVFDENPPILTPRWCNTLDDDDPASLVTALAPVQPTLEFPISWSGTDLGSGVVEFDVYVSEEGGPFTLLLGGTKTTSATFSGQAGKHYAFYSVARDDASNEEAPPTSPDAATFVDLCPADDAKTTPGVCGCGEAEIDSDRDGIPDCTDTDSEHDLALVALRAPKKVSLDPGEVSRPQPLRAVIQNRGPRAVTLETPSQLQALVTLALESLQASACAPAPVLTLRMPRARAFPIALGSKRKRTLTFDAVFACAGDPQEGEGHRDYRLTARVDHSVLGSSDSHPGDDVCPRSVAAPGVLDPHPDGTILDKGCGARLPDKTFGGPMLIDVEVKAPRR